MLTKLAGMAFLAIVLYPRGENHHGPAEERAGQAHDEERDNVVHAPIIVRSEDKRPHSGERLLK